MAPGIYSFYDHMKNGTVGSNPASFSPPLKSSISSSSLSPLLSPFSSKIDHSSIPTDHDYVLKPVDENIQPALTLGDKLEVELIDMEENKSPHSDAMLTSCAVEMECTASQSDDTSFLQELDDLSFNIDDLNPCSGVAIEDSFQDFIDSALEKSYVGTDFQDQKDPQSQDAVILHKEDFMGFLGLKPAQNNIKSATSRTTMSDNKVFTFGSPLTPTSDSFCSRSPPLTPTDSTLDLIPTKKCSCSTPNSLSAALYSTAHSPQLESVRTSTSILATANGSRGTGSCLNCTQNRLSSRDFSTPLTIDTSYGSMDYFEPLSKECLDILNDGDDDMGSNGDEILKWLHENQQEQQQDNNNNNNITDFNNSNNGSVATFAETPNQSNDIDISMDLETFVDLEDLITTTSLEPTQRIDASEHKEPCDKSLWSSHDHTYQKPVDGDLAGHRDSFGTQLRLSFLDEFSHHDFDTTKLKQEPQSPSLIHSPSHFGMHCDDHTDTNSDFSSPFPSPSSHSQSNPNSPYLKCPEDLLKDKSHLALLDLFSDENAPSLLHSDSAVPNFRFM